jgi:hypothetical protein
MKQQAGVKHMENDCFPRTLMFETKGMCMDEKGVGASARDQARSRRRWTQTRGGWVQT